ncbi:MAG: hypothetical protein V4773_29880 [Verrucomicrobiota bacterium]
MKDFAAAEADFTRFIAVDPSWLSTYDGRAQARFYLGKLDAAQEDLEHILAKEKDHARALELRAAIKASQGDIAGMRDDLAQILTSAKPAEPDRYLIMFHALAEWRLAGRENAEALRAKLPVGKEDWCATVAKYLVGDIILDAFFTAAAKGDETAIRDQRCEAYYYSGMIYLLRGNPAAARDAFEKCLAANLPTFRESRFAHAELARMKP